MNNAKTPKRIAKELLKALRGGVVPRIGLEHIMVGRLEEIKALVYDIETIRDGGATIRFIVGNYGAGKSFLLQAIRNHAMDKGFVVLDADLSVERRLIGSTKREGIATYKELINNLSTKTYPNGGGTLDLLLKKWINALKIDVMKERQISADDLSLNAYIEPMIYQVLSEVQTIVNGYDFARVISLYWKATINDDDALKDKTLKWLKGEYTTKTEAKHDLGVNAIITDEDWYEYIKLLALFVVKAGYKGILMLIDELVYISELPHSATRRYNYEKILALYNDTMQGKAQYLGIVMGVTPQCLEDERKGMYSYNALRARLENSRFSDSNVHDLLAPVITLKPLEPGELFVLIEKLTQIHGLVYEHTLNLSKEELTYFIQNEYSRIGASQNLTPREVIKDFIEIMNIIYQNPKKTLKDILSGGDFVHASSENEEERVRDEFKGFEI